MQKIQLQMDADKTIKISGPLTMATANQAWQQSQALFTCNQSPLHFDLQQVTQSDSAGVALLLAWQRAARAQQKKVIFSGLSKQMLAIIKVSGLAEILSIV